jgi:hypothetical protein
MDIKPSEKIILMLYLEILKLNKSDMTNEQKNICMSAHKVMNRQDIDGYNLEEILNLI